MPRSSAKIRLYVTDALAPMQQVVVGRDASHYLLGVMRQSIGDRVELFNGRDGAWIAELTGTSKRAAELTCQNLVQAQTEPPDLWLLFAPIKKARTDFIAEKVCEMGCRRVLPVFTQHTNSERVRVDRLQAHAVEAAEQCGLVSVPEIAEPASLETVLSTWPEDRKLMFCDESGAGAEASSALAAAGPGPWAILIGPEGGFSEDEANRLRALEASVPVSLGPRILRADTAAVAALAVWQSVLGDWS
ncbi:MAG: 16S rRNA (uracil(1498)-N(3))-methyltransferase [Pseudomonadota bacterium]